MDNLSQLYPLPENPQSDLTDPQEGRAFLAAYLNNCTAWFLSTVDTEGNPHTRPMSLITVCDDQLVFGTTIHKDVHEHLSAQSACSISAYIPRHGWISLEGKAVPAENQSGADAQFKAENPKHYGHYLGEADDNIAYALVEASALLHVCHKEIRIAL